MAFEVVDTSGGMERVVACARAPLTADRWGRTGKGWPLTRCERVLIVVVAVHQGVPDGGLGWQIPAVHSRRV